MSTNTGVVSGTIDTSAVLATALERLNRQSVVKLLQQLVQEIDEHYTGVDTKINEAVDAAKTEVSQQIDNLQTTLGEHGNDIESIRQTAEGTQNALNSHINNYQSSISVMIDGQIEAKTPGIVQQAIDAMTPQVQTLINDTLSTESLTGVAAKITELKNEIALVDAAAKSLDTGELAQVSALLEQVLASKDLSGVIASASIPVNGTPVRFDKLLEALANQPKVVSLSLSYANDDISGAVFTLSNQQQAVFSATRRTDESAFTLTYEFNTANLNGLPASFELRFVMKMWGAAMCGKQVSMTQYDAVHQTNVLFNLNIS